METYRVEFRQGRTIDWFDIQASSAADAALHARRQTGVHRLKFLRCTVFDPEGEPHRYRCSYNVVSRQED